MITTRTIEELLEDLESMTKHFIYGTKPDDKWLKDLNWKIFDVRKDIQNGKYDFEGMVSNEELKKVKSEYETLERDYDELECEYDNLQARLDDGDDDY